MKKWSTKEIGSLHGKVAIVTGGTDGIGFEVAKMLATHGAEVYICADDSAKGQKALGEIKSQSSTIKGHFEQLNLADIEAVKRFCVYFASNHSQLHFLINNAGVAAIPERMLSPQGHELTFATNYLGHFALTSLLFPILRDTEDSRIIFQSSLYHKDALIDYYDLDAAYLYDPSKAYRQSKLALLIFALELDRRLRETNIDVKSIPVHPGGVRSHLYTKGPSLSKKNVRVQDLVNKLLTYTFGQSAAKGALPTLFAATSPAAEGGHFYGPDGLFEVRGRPVEVKVGLQAKNIHAAEKLWEISEKMTGINFNIRDDSNVLPFRMRGNIITDPLNPHLV
jgi:NAD(P)-dependent dehydrogenase (short-subunit alcohol dehydrogenase family)